VKDSGERVGTAAAAPNITPHAVPPNVLPRPTKARTIDDASNPSNSSGSSSPAPPPAAAAARRRSPIAAAWGLVAPDSCVVMLFGCCDGRCGERRLTTKVKPSDRPTDDD
jgi:hypothetical protein